MMLSRIADSLFWMAAMERAEETWLLDVHFHPVEQSQRSHRCADRSSNERRARAVLQLTATRRPDRVRVPRFAKTIPTPVGRIARVRENANDPGPIRGSQEDVNSFYHRIRGRIRASPVPSLLQRSKFSSHRSGGGHQTR
jgi:hypothetical protein